MAECPPNTPVLVGVAAVQQKLEDFKLALEPIALMEHALRDAARDAGSEALLSRANEIMVPRGILSMGMQFPTRMSALGPDSMVSPTWSPRGWRMYRFSPSA